jgi:hypothetical protein
MALALAGLRIFESQSHGFQAKPKPEHHYKPYGDEFRTRLQVGSQCKRLGDESPEAIYTQDHPSGEQPRSKHRNEEEEEGEEEEEDENDCEEEDEDENEDKEDQSLRKKAKKAKVKLVLPLFPVQCTNCHKL